uniref:Uncharacterized protein n=1 Tax=Timema douglasi TaxID=61478 RepID=A0A7R8VJX9_TIMDO|nr:unnamed protein product [Timema douglasi]
MGLCAAKMELLRKIFKLVFMAIVFLSVPGMCHDYDSSEEFLNESCPALCECDTFGTLGTKKLNPILLSNVQHMTSLDVSFCNIEKLWGDQIPEQVLPRLETLNLAENNLQALTPGELEMIGNLRELDITKNPFKCDKSFNTLIEWLKGQEIFANSLPSDVMISDKEDKNAELLLTDINELPEDDLGWILKFIQCATQRPVYGQKNVIKRAISTPKLKRDVSSYSPLTEDPNTPTTPMINQRSGKIGEQVYDIDSAKLRINSVVLKKNHVTCWHPLPNRKPAFIISGCQVARGPRGKGWEGGRKMQVTDSHGVMLRQPYTGATSMLHVAFCFLCHMRPCYKSCLMPRVAATFPPGVGSETTKPCD